MSSFECKVYKLTISEHPNADAIELAQVGDYRSIVKKGQFKTGDLGVYIPEAAIVPELILERLNLVGKLAGKAKNRVKAIKLRGILSQGLIYPVEFRPACISTNTGTGTPDIKDIHCVTHHEGGAGYLVEEGTDVMNYLGISKYEPVIPTSMSGEVFNAFGNTLKFDIENIKKFPDVFQDGEEVTFTEKLHGTWSCFGYHPEYDFPVITSKGLSDKGLAFKFNEANLAKNLYVKTFDNITSDDKWLNILELFVEVKTDGGGMEEWEHLGDKPFYILGEIFGAGVQDLTYDLPKQFRVFDIYIGQPGHGGYLDAEEVRYIVKKMSEIGNCDISYVPLLFIGAYNKEVLDDCTNGKETVSGNSAHMREGIVIRPMKERRHDEIGRVILKSVSEAYLLRKGNATEYT